MDEAEASAINGAENEVKRAFLHRSKGKIFHNAKIVIRELLSSRPKG